MRALSCSRAAAQRSVHAGGSTPDFSQTLCRGVHCPHAPLPPPPHHSQTHPAAATAPPSRRLLRAQASCPTWATPPARAAPSCWSSSCWRRARSCRPRRCARGVCVCVEGGGFRGWGKGFERRAQLTRWWPRGGEQGLWGGGEGPCFGAPHRVAVLPCCPTPHTTFPQCLAPRNAYGYHNTRKTHAPPTSSPPPPAARYGPPIAQSVELSLRLAVIQMHGVCFDDVLRMLREHSSELGIQDEACIAAAINKVRMVWVGGRMCGSSPKAGPNSSSASLFAWRPAHGFLARHASLFVSHTSSCLAFFICFLCGRHACAQQLRV